MTSDDIDPSDDNFDEDVERAVRALFEEGEHLSDATYDRLVELGSRAVPRLVEVLENEDFWDEAAPGDGWAPIYAARALGDIGDPSALEPMYEALGTCQPEAMLDSVLTRALQSFGDEAIEPGIAVLNRRGDEFRADLACVFADLGVRDRRAFQVILQNFVEDPYLGAENLAVYGDPEGLDALFPMLERYLQGGLQNPDDVEEAVQVADAIEALGGELEDQQRAQINELRGSQSRAREIIEKAKAGELGDHHHPDTYVRQRDIGRNDPCWCGSGDKYKHCHWRDDRRQGNA
jgi:HEAT repeat protein